ncbi:flagellar hook capping protein [Ruminococcaceae bacterium AM07-15]|nr:flagellar hook capping protein [Ruminococcaceae bacterium AM07-15]
MSNDFMPMSLNSLNTAYSTKTTSPSISDLERQGINVIEQGEDTGLQFEDFLQLMVQQLQNQTMDNTADTSEMLNQLVQMSTVEMLSTVKDGLEALVNASTLNYAASLVGKTVTVGRLDDEGKLEEVVGTVTGTGTYQGISVIFVDGEMYALNDIMAIGELPELPEEPEEPGEGGETGDGEGGDENGQETQSVG